MRGATMRKETEKAINKMRQLHEEGKTIEEIAETTGYKVGSVKVMLNRAGVKRAKKIDPFMPTIIEMHKNGITVKEIAKKVGFNASYVSHVLCKNGYRKINKDRTVSEVTMNKRKLVYADHTIKIPRVVIGGKKYLDVTALF